MVLRYCRYRLRDADSAEDVANTVFVRLLETRPRLKSSFTGLLLRTARNLCATHLAKRRPLIEPALDAEADESGDPAQDMERRDAHAALAECLDRLPETDRTLIVLHHGEGLTYRQVNEVLSLRAAFSTLTRRLKRIKAKLLACLKEKKIF